MIKITNIVAILIIPLHRLDPRLAQQPTRRPDEGRHVPALVVLGAAALSGGRPRRGLHSPVPRRRRRRRARARARDAGALRDRLRQRRLVDLLRARRHRGLRARPDAARLRDRRAHLRADGARPTPRGRFATRRPAAPRASRATPSTSSSRSGPPGRRCSTTSSRSPSRRSSCRTTSRSSGSRCRTNPWDIIGGAVVIVVLVALNIVGIQESARLNIVLAVIDFATQLLLVAARLRRSSSARRSLTATCTGASRRPGRNFAARDPGRR